MMRHYVHLRFKNETTPEIKQGLYDQLAALSGHIDGILDFQHRANVSVETPLVRDFNDMFWFDFRDSVVRDTYLVDSVHQAVGGQIVAEVEGGPDGVFVCDIEL